MKHSERGNSVMEFALVAPFLILLMVGSFVIGMSMVKSVEAQQVNRNAGILFMKFVDMSQISNQDIIIRTAAGLNMRRGSGNGLVILSQVLFVGDNECRAGGLEPGACPNHNQYVFTKRIEFGNLGLSNAGSPVGSRLGNPSSSILQPDGSIRTTDYLTNGSAIVTGFPMNLSWGEFTFVSESWFITPELNFPGFYNNTAVYAIYLT